MIGNQDRLQVLHAAHGSVVWMVAAASLMLAAGVNPAQGESVVLRSDWRFHKGDVAGAAASDFDDSTWNTVRIPHDWAIAGPFTPREHGSTGKLPWRGVGWYRRNIELNCEPDERVYLDFDGVMAFPKVYVNGRLAGEWDYGYTSFRIDATPYVKQKGDNVIAVRVDTTQHMSRWYPGAGIYRKVALQVRKPVHIAQWGVQVITPTVTDQSAIASVKASIENHSDAPVESTVRFEVGGPDGRAVVASSERSLTLQPGVNEVAADVTVDQPQRWDIDSPHLYTLATTVETSAAVLDREETSFGFRTVELTADDGFHLNGRRVQLKGVNLHHDLGPLGAAFNVRAMQRQLEIMRDMGANAIRTSHNPPAPEALDLCDRMGLLVWDEAFDKWDETADRVDGQPPHREHAERHLRSLVMRDRNHPSVVVWSIGNEIPADEQGVTRERIAMMRDVVRKYDSTRPVGMGCHIPQQALTPLLADLDFTGWNYARRYATYRERFPDKPIIYSESASALSTRGFYELPLPKTKTDYSARLQVDSHDFNAAPWSDIADAEFKLMEQDRFVAGEFVWTGFDYLGEPTPFEQQAKSSYFGVVDLCGIPKDRFYLYRSHWRPEETTIHITPHWDWPERIGQPTTVLVYTNGDEAELFLNGKPLGRQRKGARPIPPVNLATGRSVVATSEQAAHAAAAAVDGELETRWCASSASSDQRLQVDLGAAQRLKYVLLEFEREAKNYGYVVEASEDGQDWTTCVEQPASDAPQWGGPSTAVHDVNATGRFVRLRFTELKSGAWASLREFQAFSAPAEAAYYDVIYDYRLRWNNVAYQPGTLEAVAYKDGKRVGSAAVRTAGPPAALRLTPDRKSLAGTGDDLCYILFEAIDADGNLCPLADLKVGLSIVGPAEIAGVGNGNPLSLDPFQTDACALFYGKAILIVRGAEGQAGEIQVQARADGLESTSERLQLTKP